MSGPVLEIAGLAKAYRGRPVLTGLAFMLAPGEAMALIGPNGAGKSTLLGCVTANRLPDAGTIRVCGHDPFSDPRGAAGCTGFVPEHPFLYGELTVGEFFRFLIEARGLPRERAEAEAGRLFAVLGLEDPADRLSGELSQGMARKVAVAAALLHDPELLVLDEVTNGLDLPSTEALMTELDDRRARGCAVLMSGHDLPVLAARCDRGLLLTPGGIWHLLDGPGWEAWCAAPSLDP